MSKTSGALSDVGSFHIVWCQTLHLANVAVHLCCFCSRCTRTENAFVSFFWFQINFARLLCHVPMFCCYTNTVMQTDDDDDDNDDVDSTEIAKWWTCVKFINRHFFIRLSVSWCRSNILHWHSATLLPLTTRYWWWTNATLVIQYVITRIPSRLFSEVTLWFTI